MTYVSHLSLLSCPSARERERERERERDICMIIMINDNNIIKY